MRREDRFGVIDFNPRIWMTDSPVRCSSVPEYRIRVTIQTEDGCEGAYWVTLNKLDDVFEHPIDWLPHEPDAQTAQVKVERFEFDRCIETYVIDGDMWREIEFGELYGEIWSQVLHGDGLAEAIESSPAYGGKCRI